MLALGLLAGCGDLPQPFRGAPQVSNDNPLLDAPSAVGLAVLPVKGVPAPFDTQLSAAIAAKLLTADIPAEAVDVNRGLGFSLEGEAHDVISSPSGVTATVEWTLRSRRGVSGNYRQSLAIAANVWRDGNEDDARQAADAPASAIVTMVGGQETEVAGGPGAARHAKFPRVSIKPVDGAPGDGRDSLRLALIQVLFENGVPRDDTNPEIVLSCTVSTESVANEQQKIAIVWRAVSATAGDMGTVKLENTIPNGALDGPWGPTAFAIAQAAVPDLLALLSAKPTNPTPAP